MATKSQKKKKLSAPNPSIDAKKPNPQDPVEERETPAAAKKPKKQKESKKPNPQEPVEERDTAAGAAKKPKPKKQKESKEVSAKKPKKQKESNEIDEIFEATKKRKLQQEEEESEGGKKPKKGKAEGASNKKSKKEASGKGWEPGHEEVEEKRPRRRTNDGLTIYSADELGFGKADAGGTALCPFDCDCCF